MTDFSDLVSQAKKMQDKMKEAQESLKKIEVEGVSGGDAVKVIMNGDNELKKVILDDNLLKEPKEIIEDLVVSAVNDAKSKIKKKTTDEISKATGGINFPPGFKEERIDSSAAFLSVTFLRPNAIVIRSKVLSLKGKY